MIQIERWGPVVALALLVAGCDRSGQSDPPAAGGSAAATSAVIAPAPGHEGSPRANQIDPTPQAGTASRIVESRDIEVAGRPACALTVRYAGDIDQPATWHGELCTALTMRFIGLRDLATIGQDGKLDKQAREAVNGLPDGKILYVEGAHASAIFAPNEAGLLVRTDLAD